jgi:2,4-dienoyl-CoA reductase (NADPH2)
VNAALSGEEDYTIQPAKRKKKVLVVGGGPAGMEAARVAAMRGHEVILYEKESSLGGLLLPLANLVNEGKGIEDIPALIHYLKTQITKLGVNIRLGQEFTPSLIEEIKPDTIILATGGIPDIPKIPGISRSKVFSIVNPNHIKKFQIPSGERVIIIGGAIYGCQLAEVLVKEGRKVTIVDTGTEEVLGEGLPMLKEIPLLKWLSEKGVTMMTGVKYEKITDNSLTIITREGQRVTIEADAIATAIPLKANTELLKSLEGKAPEVQTIGDCNEPNLIIDAIADGYRIARAI